LQLPSAEFGDYWYQGLAELNAYTLEQSRYGEIREGKAVLVFVTEDFSKSKHLKLDNPQDHPNDKVAVLKLNFMRNFQTGIYPYSIMSSSFMRISGIQAGIADKVSLSVQEWCGHVFDQVYRDGRKYKRELSSYFESEGEREEKLNTVPIEQALWNSIRIDPGSLPIGDFQCIPDQVYSRLLHEKLEVKEVTGEISDVLWEGMQVREYSLKYPDLGRNLSIYFQKEFPYLIEGWEEQSLNLKGEKVKNKGKRIRTIQLDYWNKNANANNFMYDDLFHSAETIEKK